MLTESTGNVDNPIRYAGYQYDEETGNYYLLSRMYDPTIARFLQEDTYRGEINDPLSLNLYTYVHNNPVMYDDPNGHWVHIALGALVGAAINTGITAYNDYKDDGKFNSGWKTYAGSAVEGGIVGAVGAATAGSSLLGMAAAGTAAGFAGSAAKQYITTSKVSIKKAAVDGITNGLGGVAGNYAGKALGAAAKSISKTQAVAKVKGIVLNGLSSTSEAVANISKKAASSIQGALDSIKLPAQNKLAYSTAGNGYKSAINATFDYADNTAMNNFNKIYNNKDAIQKAARAADDKAQNLLKANVNKGVGEATGSAEKSISRKVAELKSQGFQEHHIISNKNNLTKEHELFDLAGYNTPDDFLQSQRNKIYLPSDASLHPTRSIHKGRHLNSVSQNLADQMDAVVMQGNMEGWTAQQFDDALSQIVKGERAELRSGQRILNKNHR